MEQKLTLKELARMLNLSTGTISKALNDKPEISAQTRSRVKQLAALNDYIPNGMAQSLKAKETKTIGVIIPNILHNFFAKALDGIETMAGSLGYKIIICISKDSIEKEAASLNTLISARVDGLIISLAKETQQKSDFAHIKRAMTYGIPVVLFDRVSTELSCDCIAIDDQKVAEKATIEMHKSGCRKIAYLSTIYDTSVNLHRQKGYSEAMNNINLNPLVVHIENYEIFEKKLLAVLKKNTIDGILAADELSAVFTMRTLINNGYKIPEDISVIGFTNSFMGENFLPSLTTVEQYAGEQGSLSAKTLVARIQGELPPEPVSEILETMILHRDSTKPLLKL